MRVNERRTVVGGLIGHCVSPNRGERSTRMPIAFILLCRFNRAVVQMPYFVKKQEQNPVVIVMQAADPQRRGFDGSAGTGQPGNGAKT